MSSTRFSTKNHSPYLPSDFWALGYTQSTIVVPFEHYAPLARANSNTWKVPIYVGKAVPKGARKGGFGLGADPGIVLYSRLTKHANTIGEAENLDLDDFACRFLVIEDIWIPLGESLLIEMFAPLWNTTLDGFGINDPGGGRRDQRRSGWDTIHPGRSWAELHPPNDRTVEELSVIVTHALGEN